MHICTCLHVGKFFTKTFSIKSSKLQQILLASPNNYFTVTHTQDEVETGREELTFKTQCISDLEAALRREKEHSSSLTAEMQVHT